MRANEFIGEAILDPRGWGGTPYGTDIDYFGLRVQMKPSTFLKLALPLGPEQTNLEVEKHMSAGGKIAYPMLDIEIPESWKDGDYSKPAEVVDHEGRNRMTQWIKLKGDDPIQVNIRPRGGIRRRNLSDDYIEALSKGLVSQRGNYITNPFSADTVLENELVHSDNSPKLSGLSFSDLHKLSESAGNNYEKFDRKLKENLNLPHWFNTMQLYGVYVRKLNETKLDNTLLEESPSNIERELFSELNKRSVESVDSAKRGDSVSLLHLITLNIPGNKVYAKLSGFLNPKEIVRIIDHGSFQQLEFADGSKYPEKDFGDIFQQTQTWNMTKLFPTYAAASKAYIDYALIGKKLSAELDFQTTVDKHES